MKKIIILIVSVVLLFPIILVQAAVTPDPVCLTISGTAVVSPKTVDVDEPVNLTYTLTPGGSYTQVTTRDPVNMMLVLDESGSMGNSDGKNTQTRINILKTAAKNLVDQLSSLGLGDQIGLIKFSDVATNVMDLTTNYSALKAKIDLLTPNGGTNIEHGLRKAKDKLTGKSSPFVVLVTDGYATNYYNDSTSKTVLDYVKAKSMALTAASQLAGVKVPVYTVALGAADGNDVDHGLLTSMASTTGGQKYSASDATQLSQVFTKIQQQMTLQGAIKTISIRQPIPNGFVIADPNSKASLEKQLDGSNVMVIPVSDIQYPYSIINQTVSVNIKQTNENGGTYTIGSGSVSYKVPCHSNVVTSPINLNETITVLSKVTVKDKYGNIYVGNRFGDVTRYRLGDYSNPQWTVPGDGKPRVSAITFNNLDHSSVHIVYTSSSIIANWNLMPKTPTSLKIKDAKNEIIMTPAEWKRGPATVDASGSDTWLPANTEYKNADFGLFNGINNYIQYQYQANNGAWRPNLTPTSESGQNIEIKARAATAAITGNPDVLLSEGTISQRISLDTIVPEVPLVLPEFTTTYQQYKYTISNLRDNQSGFDNAVLKNALNLSSINVNENSTFTATEADIQNRDNPTYKIIVMDKVGLTTSKKVTEQPIDLTAPIFDLGTVNNHITANQLPNNDKPFRIEVSEVESYIYDTQIMIDGVNYRPTPQVVAKRVVYTFNLSDVMDADKRAGYHTLTVTSKNGSAQPFHHANDYFIVDPGPKGTLTTEAAVTNRPFNMPVVLVAHYDEVVVPAVRLTYPDGTRSDLLDPVKVIEMKYALMPDGNKPALSSYHKLGAYRFRIEKEGESWVSLRLTDSLGNDNLGNWTQVPKVNFNIQYNQKRY